MDHNFVPSTAHCITSRAAISQTTSRALLYIQDSVTLMSRLLTIITTTTHLMALDPG